MKSILVITGMSGSGKSTAIRALEDAGWFCIDNLPAPLLLKVTELGESKDHLAFVVDVREGQFLKDAPRVIEEARRAGHSVEVLFLDSSDEALTRRYSETRRRHPLAGQSGVAEGLAKERAALADLRQSAEHVLDTSSLTVHELRREVTSRFGQSQTGLSLTVMSFGFKYGIPVDADVVLDARFLPNPHWVDSLREHTGLDSDVRQYVLDAPAADSFLTEAVRLLDIMADGYLREGKRYVTVAVGCTGGKHRSVALAEEVAARLGAQDIESVVVHRDLGRE